MATSSAQSPGAFRDDEFETAAKEFLEPDLEGWELFMERLGFKMYRRFDEPGVFEYIIAGGMADIDAKLFLQVHLDWEYRKTWDSYVLGLKSIRDESEGVKGLHWCVDYPWPISDRDYTFIRERRVLEVGGKETHVVLEKCHPFTSIPEKKGIVRVEDFSTELVVQSDGAKGFKGFMHYRENPKGSIPRWLINWVTKTGFPRFMNTAIKAAFAYGDFLEKKRKEMGVGTLDNEERIKKLYK